MRYCRFKSCCFIVHFSKILSKLFRFVVLQEIKHFYKTVILNRAFLLYRKVVYFVTDIPYCLDALFPHAFVSFDNGIVNLMTMDVTEFYNLENKWEKACTCINFSL